MLPKKLWLMMVAVNRMGQGETVYHTITLLHHNQSKTAAENADFL
jgi:hypothetical protein